MALRSVALPILLAAVGILLLAPTPASAQAPAPTRGAWVRGDIPTAFHGTWVRGDAACGAPLSLTIEARRVSFRHGAQQQRFDRLSICKTCNDRSDDSGTVWVRSEAADGSPFLLYMTPGAKPFVTMNWRPLEDVLPKRYPLAPEPLKKCPA
jgi:hypothetical protein